MDKNIWTAEAVQNAVLQDSQNLELVFSNYLKAFVEQMGDYDNSLEGISSIDQLHQKVVDGIALLEPRRKELLSVVEMFAASKHPFLEKYLPVFFEKLLNFYEEQGVTLYTGTGADVLRNDHYRFFNQFLFISLTATLIENRCFEALRSILHTKYLVFYKSYGMVREVNFMRFREYNYTLNEFLNTNSPKRISVTADYIYKYSDKPFFGKLVKADILLYYISLWNPSSEMLDPYWYPELSVYNREKFILPNLVSKRYFEEAKVLFGVDSVQQFRELIDATEDRLQRGGVYRVPQLRDGLMYASVGSVE